MGTLNLTAAEVRFVAAVGHGDPVELEPPEVIRAEVIRHVVFRLPLTRFSRLSKAIQALNAHDVDGRVASVTPVGITIRGGQIEGRLELDSAREAGGSPICPLSFTGTHFSAGLSGRHTHFSTLNLNDCTFDSPDDPDQIFPPTIDLTDVIVDSDLAMRGIAPGTRKGLLWVRLLGAQIDGNLDLSQARLRAPNAPAEACTFDPPVVPLNLSLATVQGDFYFLGGASAEGTIHARSCEIRGDAWLSGARINLGHPKGRALFLQLAKIGGSLMLDGRKDESAKPLDLSAGTFRRFRSDGTISLFSATVGGSVVLEDCDLRATGNTCLNFTGARVDGRISLGRNIDKIDSTLQGRIRFDSMEVGTRILISEVRISNAFDPDNPDTIDARALKARHLLIRKIAPIEKAASAPAPARRSPNHLSIALDNAQLERLTIERVALTGGLRADRMTCGWEAVIGGRFTPERPSNAGSDAGQTNHAVSLERAVIGGSLDISRLVIPKGSLSLANAAVARSLRLNMPNGKSEFSVNDVADLTGLSCDMLEDNLGASWGTGVRICMNHFTYQRTDAPTVQASKRDSHQVVADRLRAREQERGWPWTWIWRIWSGIFWLLRAIWNWSSRFTRLPSLTPRHDDDFWEPWQLRRNWLYRQFLEPGEDDSALANRRIGDSEYRPQPFCQAIEVAHREGEERTATNLEIVKQKIEWRLFNRRVRWPLAFIAIFAATAWLFYKTPRDQHSFFSVLFTLATLTVVIAMMLFIDRLWRWLKRRVGDSSWRPMVALWICFAIPPALLLVLLWWGNPLHFLVALFIFTVLRLTSWLAHVGMRFMFGYLRRPIRAIATLILAFIAGWWGVWFANERGVMVVEHEAVATSVVETEVRVLAGGGVPTNLPCGEEINEALYALDVLIPLLDLHEEGRCKMGRAFRSAKPATTEPASEKKHPSGDRPAQDSGWSGFWEARHALTIDDPDFWAVLKVIYAIAGWIIVSMSILTFAHITRARFGRSDGG